MIMTFYFYLLLVICVRSSKNLATNLLARCLKATHSTPSVA